VNANWPLDLLSLEEDRPVLAVVAAGLYMAMSLILPAVVDSVWNGCRAVGSLFLVDRVAGLGEGPGSSRSLELPEPTSEGPWQPWS
jgi:hypothetical protein